MLQFNALGFPVVIQPWFWITAVLFGGGLDAGSSRDAWITVAYWVIAMFISILIHELGHALAARRYGNDSFIVLHGFGGVTCIPNPRLSRDQDIWVSFSGPLASFLLALVVIGLRKVIQTDYPGFHIFMAFMYYINVFWTLMNLLPVLPLDGGQIFRGLVGPSRESIACMVGGVVAVMVCLYAIKIEALYMAIMFGYFAYINFSNGTAEGGVLKR